LKGELGPKAKLEIYVLKTTMNYNWPLERGNWKKIFQNAKNMGNGGGRVISTQTSESPSVEE